MELIHELLGYEFIKIVQKEGMFRFSTDSMLLASFIDVSHKPKKIIELGCGNAPILLFLTLKTNASLIGVEIQKEVADMAKKSVLINHFEEQIEIVNDDFINIYKKLKSDSFDIVIANPPYFKYQENSNVNKTDFLTIARHEVKSTLQDFVVEAKKLLVEGGSFCLVHRAERLSEIVLLLKENNLEIKRMQFVYSKKNSPTALLVLIEAKKNRKTGMQVLNPLYIYEEDGQFSQYIKKIFNYKKV